MKSIETKEVKTVNNKTLIVTVDISKMTNVGYCRCPDGTETKPFKFNNNGQGGSTPFLWRKIVPNFFVLISTL